MDIVIVGTGYVGLVTGVALAEAGHTVTCLDINKEKIAKLKAGKSPIYEPGLEELLKKNIEANRLFFTINEKEAYTNAKIIMITVGTPEQEDGSANLTYLEEVIVSIGKYINNDVIVIIKSTVPVGTSDYIKDLLNNVKEKPVNVEIVSNPEFLREGSAINDALNGDRIVIGSDSDWAAGIVEQLYEPFNITIFKTDIRSAEMIKYASNAFLATKISFINEIANLCSKLDANIDDVSKGMGLDKRIGNQFLQAGIGYGGSCFPKDTKALAQIATNVEHHFELLEAVIKVNQKQQRYLLDLAKEIFPTLKGLRVALLGLAFKPNTDDMRESASILLAQELIKLGAQVTAYDPVAIENAVGVLPDEVVFIDSINDALVNTHCAMIITDWENIKQMDLNIIVEQMSTPILLDGRNCFDLKDIKRYKIDYYSIGRPPVLNRE
jgi:UDPglucose 6-dehydrogenase